MNVYEEKQKLGIAYWHSTSITKGDRSSVYVDVYPTRDRGAAVNQEVLLATQGKTGPVVFVEMIADDAEMLGMRLIAAARLYREQELEEADDE